MVFWARVVGGSFQIFSSESSDGLAWSGRVQRVDRPGLDNIQPHVLDLGEGQLDLYWERRKLPVERISRSCATRLPWTPFFRIDSSCPR